jgi:hypothetical protein
MVGGLPGDEDLTDKRVEFIDPGDKLALLTDAQNPSLDVQYDMKLKTKGSESEVIGVVGFIGVKGVKAKGKRITMHPVRKVDWIIHEAEETEVEESGSQEIKKSVSQEVRKSGGEEVKRKSVKKGVEPEIPLPVVVPEKAERKAPKKRGKKGTKGEQMELPL